MTDVVRIDGSTGEGGGQILRSSLALSLLTGRSLILDNIRAGRQRPGLQPQHRMSVLAAAQIGQATTDGVELGSTRITFEPGPVTPGRHHFAIGTAGACSLVLQTVYLPLAYKAAAASEVTVTGGTHVPNSPAFEFLQGTWSAYLTLAGLQLNTRLKRAGFYPRGGGILEASIAPCAGLHGIDFGEFERRPNVRVRSMVSSLAESIAQRQANRARELLEEINLKVDVELDVRRDGLGTAVSIEIDTQPVPTVVTALGARGKLAEAVAEEAVDQVRECLARPPAVDKHSTDQLILPLALATGPSKMPVQEVTSHLLTNLEVIRRFVERTIGCAGELGEAGCVTIGA